MTRVYRDPVAGVTWVERGAGSPLLAVPDHGEAQHQWSRPDARALVYDDEIGQTENDQLDAARDRLLAAVGASKIPPTAKHEVRGLIVEALGGGATPAAAQGTITK
jgi:hypothetical protein